MHSDNKNVVTVKHNVSRSKRAELLGVDSKFHGCTVWFTGLSGAGKTTLSFAVEAALTRRGIPCYGLDGDNCRTGLNKNLGFSPSDRAENIRRVGEVSKLFADGGIVALSSFISPYEADRQMVRELHDAAGLPFLVCHVATPLHICEGRDPKGLYKRARRGEIKGFTGIDSKYEPPAAAEITVGALGESKEECVKQVLEALEGRGIIPGTQPDIVELFVPEEVQAAKAEEASTLPVLPISNVSMQWLQVLAEGWASPLQGFMREREFLQCLHFNSVKSAGPASNMSVPIVLPCTAEQRTAIKGQAAITLTHSGKAVAILRGPEVYDAIKEERCSRTFGLHHAGHPYVKQIYDAGDFLVGGELEVLDRITWGDGLDKYRKTPLELRAEFQEMGADAVYAFQTRNPIHNGHALLMQDTHEKLVARGFKKPVLLLHPLGGWTKDDDVPLDVRMKQHDCVLAEGVLKPENTVVSIFPSPMLYAGPTEVQWHAKARANAGANFYIVGRDPAGISHPVEDRNMFQNHHGREVLSMAPGLQSLEILPFRVAAYHKPSQRMAFFDEEHAEDYMFISGSKMRKYARSGETPPEGFMCPSGWKLISDFYRTRAEAM